MFDIAVMAKWTDTSSDFYLYYPLFNDSQGTDGTFPVRGISGSTVSLLSNLGLLTCAQEQQTVLVGAVAKEITTEFDNGKTISILSDCDVLGSLGLSASQVKMYSKFLAQGNILIFIDGYEEEIARAYAVLRTQEFELFESYNILPRVISAQQKNINYIFSKNKLDTVA